MTNTNIIYLNVGGQMLIQFEIPYERFFAYPESLLAQHMGDLVKLKLEEAKVSKKKLNFFIDRDPTLFSHIHHYYLTGECYFHENADPVNGHQITYDELVLEFKYYQFPVDAISLPKRLQVSQELSTKESEAKNVLTQNKIAQLRGAHINYFVETLQKIILELILVKCSRFSMLFTHRQNPPIIHFFKLADTAVVEEKINAMLDPFGSSGATILQIYRAFIQEYMKKNIPILSEWNTNNGFDPEIGQYYEIDLRIIITNINTDNVFFETSLENRAII
ncbi:4161_t:CDS:2 [Ambispora leptoticha]|uniref:4161_t:CDS:1 n=1 Tax=Ambispora leptoticha TaxID=144679 RepID=A0A9N9HF38_9GLOM|nr:4161_t:CDS:2 [Ambispora leptoticha]